MAAFALVAALRGGRGPAAAAAATALGRRRLAGADPSNAPTRRWFASGSGSGNGNGAGGPVANGHGSGAGGPVANGHGNGAGGPGAGMGAVPSWTGCTGACAKEVLDLRAEMLWNNHQVWMRINNLAEENVALRALIAKNEVNAKSRLMDLTYKLIYSGVAASIGTVVYYLTPTLEYRWYQLLHDLADLQREQEEAARAEAEKKKPPKDEEDSRTNKPPKEEEGSGTDKSSKEKEVGGPKQSLKVERDGGVDAKSPKEEEKHGNAAEPPKKWGFFGI